MIAVRIAPDMRMAVVGSPSYFGNRPEPKKPQDLIGHNCIGLRLPTHGGLYAWEFGKGGRDLRVRVEGQLVFNSAAQILAAALSGFGLGYLRRRWRARPRPRPSQTRARGLVPAVSGLPSLVSEPPATDPGLRAGGRGAATPGPRARPAAVLRRGGRPSLPKRRRDGASPTCPSWPSSPAAPCRSRC